MGNLRKTGHHDHHQQQTTSEDLPFGVKCNLTKLARSLQHSEGRLELVCCRKLPLPKASSGPEVPRGT